MKTIGHLFKIMLLLTVSMSPSQAEGIEWLVGGGITIGGDELGGTSIDTVDAGELIRVYGGVKLPVADSPFNLQLTMGYHFDSVESQQGTGSFDRLEFELIPYVHLDKIRLGVGVTQHISVELDQPSGFSDYEFDDATGVVFEIAHTIGRDQRAWLHVRLVDIEYSSPSFGTVDGSYVGIGATVFIF